MNTAPYWTVQIPRIDPNISLDEHLAHFLRLRRRAAGKKKLSAEAPSAEVAQSAWAGLLKQIYGALYCVSHGEGLDALALLLGPEEFTTLRWAHALVEGSFVTEHPEPPTRGRVYRWRGIRIIPMAEPGVFAGQMHSAPPE